jgi:hypothetical protein
MSEWDNYLAETEAGDLPALAERAWLAEKEYEKAKGAYEKACSALIAEAPETAEYVINAGAYKVTITRPENWRWDQERLQKLYGEDGSRFPPFLEKKLVVNRRRFESEGETTRELLGEALKISLGRAKVKVERP